MPNLRYPDPAPELRERAFRLYMETDTPLRTIAALLGFSKWVMHARRRAWNWPERRHSRQPRPPAPPELWPDVGHPRPAARQGATRLDVTPGSTAAAAAADHPAAAATGDPAAAAHDPVAAARRLERLVAARIDALAAEAALGRDRDPERTDRRLVQLERLLGQLHKRRGYDGGPDDAPPARSVADLRDDLLRHLQGLRAQRRSRKLARDADRA